MGYLHQRQVTYSVKAPPISGPQAIPSWPKATRIPMKPGCLAGTRTEDRIVRPPLSKPDEPRPARARPTMSITEECAAPHMTEPNSNRMKKPK